MKTRIIFSIVAFALCGGLLASCHHNRKRIVIHRTVVVQKAVSPLSMSGRTITFDYSHAEHRELLEEEDFEYQDDNLGNPVYLKEIPWSKLDPNFLQSNSPHYELTIDYALPKMKLKGNSYKRNVRFSESYNPVFHYTYRKSGENTAIINCSGHNGGAQYILTFETPRSGTATLCCACSADREEVRGIRFSIE